MDNKSTFQHMVVLKSIHPGLEQCRLVQNPALLKACNNLGIYLFISEDEFHSPLKLIFTFLQKFPDFNEELLTHIICGYLMPEYEEIKTLQAPEQIWRLFGIFVARQLAIDDGSYYDRSRDVAGEQTKQAKQALDFIAAVPKTYLNEFLVGMGLLGFKTADEQP